MGYEFCLKLILYKEKSEKRRLFFILACDVGLFGSNCNETCGHCLKADQCFITNGSCFGGCMEGYFGATCHGKLYDEKQPEAVSLISCGNMYHLKYHYQKIGNVIELILFSTKRLFICFCKCKKIKKKTGKGIKSNLNHVK